MDFKYILPKNFKRRNWKINFAAKIISDYFDVYRSNTSFLTDGQGTVPVVLSSQL